MSFSPRMTVAVRVMALNRNDGWIDELRLVRIHGVGTRTLAALDRAGVAERRTQWNASRTVASSQWRLTQLAADIADAVRA